MAVIKIEGGTYQSLVTGLWYYDYEDTAGFHSIEFVADRRPKIGDTIENGVLVDAVLPQSNQDKSRWIDVTPYEWPEDK